MRVYLKERRKKRKEGRKELTEKGRKEGEREREKGREEGKDKPKLGFTYIQKSKCIRFCLCGLVLSAWGILRPVHPVTSACVCKTGSDSVAQAGVTRHDHSSLQPQPPGLR